LWHKADITTVLIYVRDLVDIRGKADIARADTVDLLLFGNDAHPRYRYPRSRQVI
jgi:hypothetical protein